MKFSDDFYKHGLAMVIALAIVGIGVSVFVLSCWSAQACDDNTVIVPAIGIEELVDKIWDVTISSDSLRVLGVILMTIDKRAAQAFDSGIDTTNWGTDITDTTDWVVSILPAIDTLLSDRCRHPERWYVKSVDTIHFIIGRRVSDCFRIDTTWAKKVSLADVWLTPNQVIKLKWLVGAVPPDTIKWQD